VDEGIVNVIILLWFSEVFLNGMAYSLLKSPVVTVVLQNINNDGASRPNRRRVQELPAIPGEEERPSSSAAAGKNPYDTMEFSTNVTAGTVPSKPHPAATPRNLAESGTYEEIGESH